MRKEDAANSKRIVMTNSLLTSKNSETLEQIFKAILFNTGKYPDNLGELV
jgi:hypothetical protein